MLARPILSLAPPAQRERLCRTRSFWPYLVFLAWLCTHSAPLFAAKLPSGAQVLRKVQEGFAGIQDYTVDVDLKVSVPGVQMPEVCVRVLHKRPDKTKWVPLRGFAVVPRGSVLVGEPLSRFGERATIKVLGKGTVAGRPAYYIKLLPKEGERFRTIEAWVDSQRWVLLRLRRQLPTGDPLTVDLNYQRVNGKYWLPSQSVAHVQLPAYLVGAISSDSTDLGGPPGLPQPGEERTAERVSGTVTVTFKNYQVNTGLSDSLFEESEAPTVRALRRGSRRR